MDLKLTAAYEAQEFRQNADEVESPNIKRSKIIVID